jgi:hypothetical protein
MKRIRRSLAALGAIATILTFIFTYVLHQHTIPDGAGGGFGPKGGVSSVSHSYPAQFLSEWMSDCETSSPSASPSVCGCELSYFEQHASYRTFLQYYSGTIPGTVPAQFTGAAGQCGFG